MKKIVSLVLALVLVMALATTAFAATETITTGASTAEVKAQYTGEANKPDVISVDVTWGAMTFTYTEGGNWNWQPGTHTYADGRTYQWAGTGNTVEVVNHSNVAVDVEFGFAAAEGYNVTGTFDITEDTLTAGVENKYDEADSVTATLTLAGELKSDVKDATKVGTVTVTLK